MRDQAGPVTAPSKSRYADLSTAKPRNAQEPLKQAKEKATSKSSASKVNDVEEDDEELSELSSNAASDFEDISDDEEADEKGEDDEATEIVEAPVVPKRKRKNRDAYDDLEASYLQKLVDDEPSGKRLKADETAETVTTKGDDED